MVFDTKLDDSDLGYIILRRVLKAELQDITKEIEKRGEIAKVKSILSTVDGYGSNDKIQLSLKGRGRSSNSVDANHGREGAEVVRLDKSETDWGERDRRNGSGDNSSGGTYQPRADLEVSQEELAEFTDFISEVSAHMGEMLLGSEAFIDNLVAMDGNIAQKAVAKIKSLKAMFERLGNAEASAEYKFLKKAENLYLKAAEKASDAQLIRYITSDEWDKDDVAYDKKKEGEIDGRKEYQTTRNEKQTAKESVLGHSEGSRWGDISYTDERGRIRVLSEVVRGGKELQKIKAEFIRGANR